MLLLALAAAGGAGLYHYLSRPAGAARPTGSSCACRWPALFQKLYISRCLRTLATMLASGVNVLEAVELTSSVAGNVLYEQLWMRVLRQVRNGRALSEELFNTPLIPAGVAQMVASGERAGRLAATLNRICDFCEADLAVGVRTMTSLIEPAMIVFMGLLVGFIAVSLLLPIFSISRVIAH